MSFYTYILRCADNTLYTGYTDNIEKRLAVHNAGKWAKYTRGRLPVEVVYIEKFENKSDAQKREYAIKQLSRKKKEHLISDARKHDTTAHDMKSSPSLYSPIAQ